MDLLVVAILSLAVVLASGVRPTTPTTVAIEALRRAGIVLALGTVRVLREPVGGLAESCPFSRMRRFRARLIYLALVTAAVWSVLILITTKAMSEGTTSMPLRDLTMEFATTVVLVSLFAELLRKRLSFDVAAATAPPIVVLLLFAGATLLPDRLPLFADGPADAGWAASHRLWFGLFSISLFGLLWLARDPAATFRHHVRSIHHAKVGKRETRPVDTLPHP